jgi:Mrp family chromosome partitioning ATPase
MLVLRSGETDREMAESRLKILDRLPIRLLGAVLNDVRTGGGVYKYYFVPVGLCGGR